MTLRERLAVQMSRVVATVLREARLSELLRDLAEIHPKDAELVVELLYRAERLEWAALESPVATGMTRDEVLAEIGEVRK